jgi:hypothetical protein
MRFATSLVDVDGAAGPSLGQVMAAAPAADGETVTVTHSVVVVVVVELHELSAPALTSSAPSAVKA